MARSLEHNSVCIRGMISSHVVSAWRILVQINSEIEVRYSNPQSCSCGAMKRDVASMFPPSSREAVHIQLDRVDSREKQLVPLDVDTHHLLAKFK